MKNVVIAIVVIALGIWCLTIVGINIGSSLPKGYSFGVVDGKLAPCKSSPNCVSSQAADPQHAIAPIPLRGSVDQEHLRLVTLICGMPRSTIVSEHQDYIRAEFRSKTFKYVDDVEFYIDAKHHVIHVRSAARTGYGDMGVNRQRVELFRKLLHTLP